MRTRIPLAFAAIAFGVTLWTFPAWWCGSGAGEWFSGDSACQNQLARTVAGEVARGLSTHDYKTQSERFDGEWLFGTYLMAGIGFCQIVQQHPEELEQWQPAIENCIRQLLSPAVRSFDDRAWNRGALETLSEDDGHAAYLGYLNFLLSLYRQILPESEFASWNDKITETLIRRTLASPNGLIATYPGEWYPVDNCPVLASIAIHGNATGNDYSDFLARAESHFRRVCIEPSSGLLIQALTENGHPGDLPRGSGSTLGVFFLARAFPDLGGEIFAGIQKYLVSGVFRFGAIREFVRGAGGHTDIDSGPVIFGFGFSATGFGMGGARAYRAENLFSRLYASAVLAGAPCRGEGTVDFLTAGPLGNAILLAMLTTPFAQP